MEIVNIETKVEVDRMLNPKQSPNNAKINKARSLTSNTDTKKLNLKQIEQEDKDVGEYLKTVNAHADKVSKLLNPQSDVSKKGKKKKERKRKKKRSKLNHLKVN